MEPKTPTESRTIIVAVLWILVAISGEIPAVVALVQTALTEWAPDWSDIAAVTAWALLLISGIAQIMLRSLTKVPLTLKK